ncbi:unnamed protein product [Urochloa humidicola]
MPVAFVALPLHPVVALPKSTPTLHFGSDFISSVRSPRLPTRAPHPPPNPTPPPSTPPPSALLCTSSLPRSPPPQPPLLAAAAAAASTSPSSSPPPPPHRPPHRGLHPALPNPSSVVPPHPALPNPSSVVPPTPRTRIRLGQVQVAAPGARIWLPLDLAGHTV